MNKGSCFSFYAVEAGVGEEKTKLEGQGYHNFIVLVDETPGRSPEIVEELHFVMQTNGLEEGQAPYIHAITKPGRRDLSTLVLRPYVGGYADVMVPAWNKAVEIGAEVGSLNLCFSTSAGKDAINCRAGVKAVVELLGLEYEPVLLVPGATAGIESNIAEKISTENFLQDFKF